MERDAMEMALSTDVVMDVMMRYLSSRDLLSCRLASKFWNKAASSVLRKRSSMTKMIRKEDELMELEECMRNSSDFPLVGLWLQRPWTFNSDRTIEFFQNYGVRFTRLCVDTKLKISLLDIAPFINDLPRLSILEVGLSETVPTEVQLDSKVLKLPLLRTLQLPYLNRQVDLNEEALCEIVFASSPSLQIEYLYATPNILRALERVGKLGAISSTSFNDQIWSGRNHNFSFELPSLTRLAFTSALFNGLDELKKILFSCQSSLITLDLISYESQFKQLWSNLPPVFTKLTVLTLAVVIDSDSSCKIFQGRNGHKFPVLKELQLEFETDRAELGAEVSDALFIVPTVTKLRLRGYVNEGGIKQLAQSFPNVVDIEIEYSNYSGQADGLDRPPLDDRNPFEIWSVREFKFLEKLTFNIRYTYFKRPTNNYINFDSFLTGIPVKMCEKLRKHERQDLMNSVFNEILRDHPSILQLTNLRQLTVHMSYGDGRGLDYVPEDPPFMSMVSVWYALEMMPNLRTRFFHRDPSSLSSDEARVKIATKLEAMFKYAKPFVKLESY